MLGENYAEIAVAHLLILKDPMIKQEVGTLIESGVNAEYAIYQTVEKKSKTFDSIDKYYLVALISLLGFVVITVKKRAQPESLIPIIS